MQPNYQFKLVPQSYLLVGIICFVVSGFCVIYVDYENTETVIITGKIIASCLTIIPSILLIWCGIAKRVFVYQDKLISRNMFFQNSTLFFDEIIQYEYKATHSAVKLVSLEKESIKINLASHSNILKLIRVLKEHGIHQIVDYGYSVSGKVNTDIEAYSNTDIIISGWNKKKYLWVQFILALLIINPIILTVNGRISGIKSVLYVALSAGLSVFFEIKFHKEKLIIDKKGVERIFSFKQAKFLQYEQIECVVIVRNRDSFGCNYVFYSKGHEAFIVPSTFTNLNIVMKQLEKYNVKLINSEELQ